MFDSNVIINHLLQYLIYFIQTESDSFWYSHFVICNVITYYRWWPKTWWTVIISCCNWGFNKGTCWSFSTFRTNPAAALLLNDFSNCPWFYADFPQFSTVSDVWRLHSQLQNRTEQKPLQNFQWLNLCHGVLITDHPHKNPSLLLLSSRILNLRCQTVLESISTF